MIPMLIICTPERKQRREVVLAHPATDSPCRWDTIAQAIITKLAAATKKPNIDIMRIGLIERLVIPPIASENIFEKG